MFKDLPSDSQEFKAAVLAASVKGLKLNLFHDNFDAARFNFDGVDRAHQFNVQERVFWFSWFFDHVSPLFDAYRLLGNEASRRRFLTIVAYRLAGHHSIRIATSYDTSPAAHENYLRLEGTQPSVLPTSGMFGKLKHLDFEYEGKRYVADCLGLEYYLFRKQYFYDEAGTRVAPEENDYVIDAGACLGDSAIVFGKAVGPNGKIYAFDPIEDHLEVVRFNAAQNSDCVIEAMPFGLSDHEIEGPAIRVGNYAPGFNAASQPVPLQALDTLAASGKVPRIDFIKMDIEGSEMAALRGAAASIRQFRPKLAISLYHKPNDLFELPFFILNNFPFYEMYLGHHTIHNEESVLYCQPIR